MRIAWFTPFSVKSAIGRYSQLVATELAHLADVAILTFCHPEEQLLHSDLPVHVFASHAAISPSFLSAFDICVYQIGNHWRYHGEIYLQARSRPGIVVVHDYVLQHLMAAHFFENGRDDLDGYVQLLRETECDEAATAAVAASRGLRPHIWETEEVVRYPLTGAATRGALGVIGHSEYIMKHIRRSYSGPTAILPLPYAIASPDGAGSRDSIGVPEDALLIVTTGQVNPNKRVAVVIEALGQLPEELKARLVYAVLGPVEEWHRVQLVEHAARAGLQSQLRLEGYVDEWILRTFLKHADLCVNLRFPNYEGASASVIEQLLAGKAVVTSKTGSFAELPKDILWPVMDETELPEALQALLFDASLREALGARAREYAEQTFRAGPYAAQLVAFTSAVMHGLPVKELEDAIGRVMSRFELPANHHWPQSVHSRSRKLFMAPDS